MKSGRLWTVAVNGRIRYTTYSYSDALTYLQKVLELNEMEADADHPQLPFDYKETR